MLIKITHSLKITSQMLYSATEHLSVKVYTRLTTDRLIKLLQGIKKTIIINFCCVKWQWITEPLCRLYRCTMYKWSTNYCIWHYYTNFFLKLLSSMFLRLQEHAMPTVGTCDKSLFSWRTSLTYNEQWHRESTQNELYSQYHTMRWRQPVSTSVSDISTSREWRSITMNVWLNSGLPP